MIHALKLITSSVVLIWLLHANTLAEQTSTQQLTEACGQLDQMPHIAVRKHAALVTNCAMLGYDPPKHWRKLGGAGSGFTGGETSGSITQTGKAAPGEIAYGIPPGQGGPDGLAAGGIGNAGAGNDGSGTGGGGIDVPPPTQVPENEDTSGCLLPGHTLQSFAETPEAQSDNATALACGFVIEVPAYRYMTLTEDADRIIYVDASRRVLMVYDFQGNLIEEVEAPPGVTPYQFATINSRRPGTLPIATGSEDQKPHLRTYKHYLISAGQVIDPMQDEENPVKRWQEAPIPEDFGTFHVWTATYASGCNTNEIFMGGACRNKIMVINPGVPSMVFTPRAISGAIAVTPSAVQEVFVQRIGKSYLAMPDGSIVILGNKRMPLPIELPEGGTFMNVNVMQTTNEGEQKKYSFSESSLDPIPFASILEPLGGKNFRVRTAGEDENAAPIFQGNIGKPVIIEVKHSIYLFPGMNSPRVYPRNVRMTFQYDFPDQSADDEEEPATNP